MVDFFFCLSGFIFYQKYSDEISNEKIDLWNFFVLRVSRLYPLILVTLLVTCVLNYFLLYSQGKFFIYQNNDFSSFFMNLLFLQSGFFHVGYSFNAPSWSLGVEFWIYMMFFFLAYRFKDKLIYVTLTLALLFLSVSNKNSTLDLVIFTPEFGRGLSSFFIGGLSFYLVKTTRSIKEANKNIIGFLFLLVAITGFTLCSLKLSAAPPREIGRLLSYDTLSMVLIVFPALISAFAISPLLERSLSIRPFELLGDISYSSYLWHVPIQLLVFVAILIFETKINLAGEKFFFTYMGFVIFVSYLSTHFFEKPAQKLIRSKFLR